MGDQHIGSEVALPSERRLRENWGFFSSFPPHFLSWRSRCDMDILGREKPCSLGKVEKVRRNFLS